MHPSVVLYSSGFPTIIAVNFDSASAILYFILPTSFRCSRLSRVIIIFFIALFLLVYGYKVTTFFLVYKFFLTFFANIFQYLYISKKFVCLLLSCSPSVVVCSCILFGSPFVALLLCVRCCLQSFADVRNTCTTPDGLPTDAPKFLEPTEIFRRTGIFIFFLPIGIFRCTRNFQMQNINFQ